MIVDSIMIPINEIKCLNGLSVLNIWDLSFSIIIMEHYYYW